MVKSKNIFFKLTMFFVLIFILLISALVYWAVGFSLPKYSKIKIISAKHIVHAKISNYIKVLSYNIAHGQGVKSLPTDWRGEKTTVLQLKKISEVLCNADADIVLLQEIDIDCNRTHHINQVEFLINKSKYSYYACANVWEKNYIPFPVFPIKHHIGKVKSANCIFSKFPIIDHERIIFDKPASNYFWYNWGYIDRGLQRVVIKVGRKKINVINIHLEAWDIKARNKQMRLSLEIAEKLKGTIILGGDFNSLPNEASKKSGFIDEPEINFEKDNTINIVQNYFKKYSQAINNENYLKNESLCLTFPSNNVSRKLDYIFAFNGAKFVSGKVLHDASTASDHLPILAIVKIK